MPDKIRPRPGETVREFVKRGGSFARELPDGGLDGPMPDEDLTTPERWLHLPSGSLEDVAARAARTTVRFYREPENLAVVSGSVLLPLLVFRGRRTPFLPFFIVSLMGGYGARMAWRASENLKIIAAAAGTGPDTRDAYSESLHVSQDPG